jgi:hypothetical protein
MKALVDQYISLDVRHWQGLGLLTPGRSQHLVWRNPAGEVVLTLMTDASREEVTLRYCYGAGGPAWRWHHDVVPIERRYFGHQGHVRPWWRCPHCDRLVALLYGGIVGLRCRRCYRLAYPSQYQPWAVTALTRAQRLRRRLSNPPGPPGTPIPFMRKGMPSVRFYRLALTVEWLEARALQVLGAQAQRQWERRRDHESRVLAGHRITVRPQDHLDGHR